ncbi:MAG TPA: DUF3024 domain-containing protein [Chromatiaceae bacterium]|nr:DUF3024 domain-containing protein [Chromatiaceae bacterium]
MAFSEFEIKRYGKAVETFLEQRRPPPHLRSQLDLGYRIGGQSIELFEIRPRWDQPDVIMELPFAKATWVKTGKVWRVYWQRADMKWHRYDPLPETDSLDTFFKAVAEDAYGCFFG